MNEKLARSEVFAGLLLLLLGGGWLGLLLVRLVVSAPGLAGVLAVCLGLWALERRGGLMGGGRT